MMNEERDKFADTLWTFGAALIGSGLLGMFIGGRTGAAIAVGLVVLLGLIRWMK